MFCKSFCVVVVVVHISESRITTEFTRHSFHHVRQLFSISTCLSNLHTIIHILWTMCIFYTKWPPFSTVFSSWNTYADIAPCSACSSSFIYKVSRKWFIESSNLKSPRIANWSFRLESWISDACIVGEEKKTKKLCIIHWCHPCFSPMKYQLMMALV